jgi:hypothetical protein
MHCPDEQTDEAVLARLLQLRPHAPQFAVVVKLVSQPSALVPLQSPNPALQAPIMQTPDEQADEAVLARLLQLCPHAPQFAVVVRLASQPSAAIPLQSPKPALQEPTMHTPAEQAGAAVLARLLQLCPHAPQFAMEVFRLVSQPSAAIPLQSPKPALQAAIVQRPDVQADAAALTGLPQLCPHAPQFVVLVRLVSQPSAGLLLQSPKPALQEDIMHAEF